MTATAASAHRKKLVPRIILTVALFWALVCAGVPGPVPIQFGGNDAPAAGGVPTWYVAIAIGLIMLVTIWAFRTGHATRTPDQRRGDLAALLIAQNLFGFALVLVGGSPALDLPVSWLPLAAAIVAATIGYFVTHRIVDTNPDTAPSVSEETGS
ncbi:hypothetical protein D9V32_07200 [Mycetocola tolaasinivorans]|uniref:DUF1648 domain-containing protein n=1 Tax=Mycetocola tolaasinivorans TaxID=76635 RepID=A0A3L7A6I4_9MICO|nr:hypothetical protein [Mycetocola tolaasinivorans]RLP75943.1 hypothetical protein D9V32_07200 [Mycetocola tolaasinivorans]